jgi:NosR/NirI family nitrous oxide reductase transcriptional regulator
MAIRDILNVSFEFSTKIGTRELPKLSKDYESNLPGLYIVGDLADAPVIKIALNQGYDVVQRMFRKDFGGQVPPAEAGVVDVVVIGAGPSGIGAALACKASGLSVEVIERERPFNTIQNYPKHKHVFAEPRDFGDSSRFPFMDSIKEDLVETWAAALEDNRLSIRQPEEVVGIDKRGALFEVEVRAGDGVVWDGQPVKKGAARQVKARRVVLAIGRRGTVNKIGCPGEDDTDKVHYGLADPDKHRGERVLVVGGGDSAVEAALALAQAGAEVAISYRQEAFSRTKLLNKERIERAIAEGRVRALYKTKVDCIEPSSVTISGPDGTVQLDNDRVFVLIGTKLPLPFLQKIGVMMEGQLTWQRVAFILSFALLTYCFYCIKAFKTIEPVAQYYWPFGPSHPLGGVHAALKANLGWRAIDGSFWGSVIYSLMITGFGLAAIRKYKSPIQTRRYSSLIIFQLIFLFGIPELLAPLIIDKPWKLYAVSVPWPLSIWSLVHTETLWLGVGAATAFVAMPLFVRFHGERFCSWACGCGGLAETLGDRWRHLAPRGAGSKKAELFGRVVLGAAAVVTLLILAVDVWRFLDWNTWGETKMFAQKWYGLVVDFWFASVVGVAFYPYLGNRVWCRFICPLRAYMELLAKYFGRLKIVANEKCIGCSECTRYCQMGIPVQKFAQLREDLANHNSACIQCGICVEVCPMDVLEVVRAEGSVRGEARRKRALPIV